MLIIPPTYRYRVNAEALRIIIFLEVRKILRNILVAQVFEDGGSTSLPVVIKQHDVGIGGLVFKKEELV